MGIFDKSRDLDPADERVAEQVDRITDPTIAPEDKAGEPVNPGMDVDQGDQHSISNVDRFGPGAENAATSDPAIAVPETASDEVMIEPPPPEPKAD